MQGSNFERTLRLGKYLLTNPGKIPLYLRYHPFKKITPLETGLPWFSYAAIDFLDSWLQPKMNVFEWGVGGSTIFYASRVSSVHSIENSQEWIDICQSQLPESITNKVVIQHLPLPKSDHENSSYYSCVEKGAYDLISVDGATDGKGSNRPECFNIAQQVIRPGGIIVVDDIWMFPSIIKNSTSKDYQIFESIGPCRPGVTQTAIFKY